MSKRKARGKAFPRQGMARARARKRKRACSMLATNSDSGLLGQKVKGEMGNGEGWGRRHEWWYSE